MITLLLPLAIFAFWIPLFLTFRAFHEKNSSAHRFLLTYWIFYAMVSNINRILQEVLGNLPLSAIIDGTVSVFNIWLFYGHGCLVVSYYFLPSLVYRLSGILSLYEFDHGILSPMIFPILKSKSFLKNGSFSDRNSGIAPLDSFSVLDYGVSRFCYMDEPAELHSRYLNTCRLFQIPLDLKRQRSRRRAGSGTLKPLVSSRIRSELYHEADMLQRGPMLPKQRRRERSRSNEVRNDGRILSDTSGRYVNMGDSWSRTTFSPRAVSDGEVEGIAHTQMNGKGPREFQVRELNKKLFVPVSPMYRP